MNHRIVLVSLLLLVGLGLSPLRAAEDELLFSDDFSTLKPGWGAATENQKVEGNKLVFTPAKNITYTQLYQGQLFGNIDLRAKISCTQGGVDNAASVVFWATDFKNLYLAELNTDGVFRVTRVIEGKAIYPVTRRVVESVKQGIGQVNEMRVVTSGERATVYVNGAQVTTFKGFPPAGESKIGFRGESGTEPCIWAFSDLTVCKGPMPTGTEASGDELLLLADNFATLDPAWGRIEGMLSGGNGKLVLQIPKNKSARLLYNGRLFEDADVRIKVTQAKGGTGAPAGLLFWAADLSNCRGVFLFPSGKVEARMGIRTNGKWQFPISNASLKAVRQGLGATNEMRVVMSGNSVTAYVNDQQVGTLGTKDRPGPRYIGLWAEADSEVDYVWEYSDVRVRKLDPPPTRPPQ